MPWRPFLAASSRRLTSGSVKKSLSRSWPSVVVASLFTFRRLVAIGARLESAESSVRPHSTLFTECANCKEYIQVPQALEISGRPSRAVDRPPLRASVRPHYLQHVVTL